MNAKEFFDVWGQETQIPIFGYGHVCKNSIYASFARDVPVIINA